MATIVLKTAKRNTTVPRLTIRRVVEAVYADAAAAFTGATSATPVVKIKKKATSKKAS